MTPDSVYALLLGKFGPQGWWPVTTKGSIRPVYTPGRLLPVDEAGRFEITLGAILTQNTAWTNVERALENLHCAGIFSPRDLLAQKPAELAALIRPSGYFTQKEKKLRIFCEHITRQHPSGITDWFSSEDLPALREELLSLWGIGPETADSMLLYAGGRPVFVIDAYTLRIGRRLGWYGEAADYYAAQRFITAALPRDVKIYNEFHALFVALAKYHCKKKPVCAGCPLKRCCPGGKNGCFDQGTKSSRRRQSLEGA